MGNLLHVSLIGRSKRSTCKTCFVGSEHGILLAWNMGLDTPASEALGRAQVEVTA